MTVEEREERDWVQVLAACVVLVLYLLFSGCASNPPPTVVMIPRSEPSKGVSWEAKLWADLKILWPCIKELRLHPTNLVSDVQDWADMKPCLAELKAVREAVADAGPE